ncbi:MAG: hypothetical protein IPM16_01830 [Chloroflexi bacterium]|nr:hypothetical protein [Chloroflexota bacterium]
MSVLLSMTARLSPELTGALSLIAVVTLLFLLIGKDSVLGPVGQRNSVISAALNILIVPLCVIFAVLVILSLAQILG